MIAKAGLGLIGLGALGVGGVALAKPSWLGMLGPMPEWHSLSEDNGYEASYTDENHFGKKHGRYLVGVTHKTGGTANDTNQAWWEWSFKRMGNKIKNSKFSTEEDSANVKSGYIGDNPLKKVCEEAYKKGDSDFQTAPSNSHFTKDEIWKYCSPLGEKPKTIAEVDKENNQYKDKVSDKDPIGKDTANRQKLVSTKGNDLFWEIKNKEFKSTTISDDGFFKTRKEKNIKEVCEEAYGKPENSDSGSEKLTKEDTVKYCSLEDK